MYWRLALGAVGWLAALALFVVGLQPGRATPRLVPPDDAPALVRDLNEPHAARGSQWWSWRVTRATSAHRALLVDVEAQRVGDARAIAAQIIEPVRTHGYDEVLIYVRPVGGAAAARRIQWTPRGGFSELVLSD